MGLILSVYRPADMPDCTNGGISSRFPSVCCVNLEGPFDPRGDCPAVMLEMGPCDSVRIVPAVQVAGSAGGYRWVPLNHAVRMFGGNYAATSDSRFGEAIVKMTGRPWYGAVAIHDRFEK